MPKDRGEYGRIVEVLERLEARVGVARVADPGQDATMAAEFEAQMTALRGGRPPEPNHPLGAVIELLAADPATPEPPGSFDVFTDASDARFAHGRRLLASYAEITRRLHASKADWRAAREAQAQWAAATGQADPYAGLLGPWLKWRRALREWARAESEAERQPQEVPAPTPPDAAADFPVRHRVRPERAGGPPCYPPGWTGRDPERDINWELPF